MLNFDNLEAVLQPCHMPGRLTTYEIILLYTTSEENKFQGLFS